MCSDLSFPSLEDFFCSKLPENILVLSKSPSMKKSVVVDKEAADALLKNLTDGLDDLKKVFHPQEKEPKEDAKEDAKREPRRRVQGKQKPPPGLELKEEAKESAKQEPRKRVQGKQKPPPGLELKTRTGTKAEPKADAPRKRIRGKQNPGTK